MTPRRLLENADDVALFDDATTRRIDRRAAAGLPPHTLMARAGLALLRLARAIAPTARAAWILAGPGNNGGDGLVLATWLHRAGLDVRVTLVGHRADRALPDDAAWALAEARIAGVAIATEAPAAAQLEGVDLAVDALLGVGQSRALDGAMAAAVALLHTLRCPVLAVDVPSGLSSATGAPLGDAAVRATHTLTLLTPKAGLLTGTGRELAGEPWFDDLGVAPQDDEPATASLTGSRAASALLPPRRHLANKGSYGDLHVAGGAAGMVGASLLAAHAGSLAGAGRVLVHTHASDAGGALPVDVRHPELMLRPMAELQAALRDNRKATVVAGCGGGDAVAGELPGCLAHAARLVLDADALNAIARDASLRALLRARGARGSATILTPHPLEAARLLGRDARQVQADRLAAARAIAADTGAIVLLKGSGTLVAAPGGRLAVNPTGDARLATAGTGDVLAGWIGGLWSAQAPDRDAIGQAFDVARAAAWIHGRACDFAAGRRLPLVAGDLAAHMARAVHGLAD
ncbi:MAG: NAD(P)H-hydrate dehydratase [Burkholderiales bacterium]|nr:NAD(P)H-hydrate dehydratase [Burkholderiales bacterium]